MTLTLLSKFDGRAIDGAGIQIACGRNSRAM
jgi:hypothetical protein